MEEFCVAIAAIAAIIHLYIFCLESVFWGRPRTNRIFGMSPEAAEQNRVFAFNQGFYNLFLSLGTTIGLVIGLENEIGKTLVSYSLLSMMLAAIVLMITSPKLLRPAVIQGLPPLSGLVLLILQ
jgi:putative membrane protein